MELTNIDVVKKIDIELDDYLKQRTRWCWLKEKYWRNYEEPRKNKTKKYNQ